MRLSAYSNNDECHQTLKVLILIMMDAPLGCRNNIVFSVPTEVLILIMMDAPLGYGKEFSIQLQRAKS